MDGAYCRLWYKTSERDKVMQFTELIAPARAYVNRHRRGNADPLPNLTVLQTTEVSEFDAVVYKPVVCLVLQGAKETTIGDQSVSLRAGSALDCQPRSSCPIENRFRFRGRALSGADRGPGAWCSEKPV
jgi:hypothetical protein